jgi:hypothetical protein
MSISGLDAQTAAEQFEQKGGGDEQLFVRFYKNPHKDIEATEEAGRPIFKEVDYIEIRQPGNKHTSIDRPIRPGDQFRFPKHWAAYQNSLSQDEVAGTPLNELTTITRSEVEEMKHFNVHTVEQLSVLSDEIANRGMGLQMLKQKAKRYLETSGNDAAEQRLVDMEKMLAKLQEQNEELKANQKKKPGRKPVEKPEEVVEE